MSSNQKYRCCLCGEKLIWTDLKPVEESRGEFWGVPCYETVYICPCCGSGDIEELEEDEEEDEEE